MGYNLQEQIIDRFNLEETPTDKLFFLNELIGIIKNLEKELEVENE